MTQDQQTAACPSCQAANLPNVKFCAECGTALATRASAVMPPTAVPTAPTPDAMSSARDALSRANAMVTGGDGQTTLDYQLEFSDRLIGPMALDFTGTVTHVPGGTPPHVITARMAPKSLAMMFGMWVAGVVVLGFIPRSLIANDMFLGATAIALAVTLWVVFAEGPKRVRRHLEGLIGAPGAMAPAAVQPSAAAPAPAGGDVFAQLERLAQLQATGLLTADDVATKKAELLQRI